MKKARQLHALLLSIILLSAAPAYAQTQTDEAQIEQTVGQSLSAAQMRAQRAAAGTIASVSTYTELEDAVADQIANIYLLQDIQLEAALQIGYDVFLLAASAGKTLYAAAGCRHIQVTAPDVQIQFDNVTLDGGYEGTAARGGIDAPYKNFSIVGATIQNCYAQNGSAIHNDPKAELGTFALYNSTIRNNQVGEDSAIYIAADDIIIYRTTAENNGSLRNTQGYGAGINLGPAEETEQSTAVIYGSVIRNNSARECGGILFWHTDAWISNDTVIEGNTATYNGGGIYADCSSVESYAQIEKNTAGQNGGGIFLMDSTYIMQDGTVSYNAVTADSGNDCYGGGIAISNSTANAGSVIINGGILEGNTAPNGGAIGCAHARGLSASTVEINGGTICNNGYSFTEDQTITNVSVNGGGILAACVKLTDGTIEQNLCSGSGGGIFAGTLEMSGGLIQDNGYYENEEGVAVVKAHSGGGVYIHLGTAAITDGLIYSNQANRGAGLYITGSLTLCAPAYIRYNHAADLYGGVYCSNTDAANVDLTRIRNNSAENGSPQYNYQ